GGEGAGGLRACVPEGLDDNITSPAVFGATRKRSARLDLIEQARGRDPGEDLHRDRFDRPWLCRAENGGGGNRTRVRGRTGASVYKLRSLLGIRPVGWFATDPPPG